jgi:hypothetical protein
MFPICVLHSIPEKHIVNLHCRLRKKCVSDLADVAAAGDERRAIFYVSRHNIKRVVQQG